MNEGDTQRQDRLGDDGGDEEHDGGGDRRPVRIDFVGIRGGQGTSAVAAATALMLGETYGRVRLEAQDPEGSAALLGVASVAEMPTLLTGTLELAPLGSTSALGCSALVSDVGQMGSASEASERAVGRLCIGVLRGPCYLTLRDLAGADTAALAGLVLCSEAGRALDRRDVEDIAGVPVLATVDVTPAVARTLDAGLAATRLASMREFAQLRRWLASLGSRPSCGPDRRASGAVAFRSEPVEKSCTDWLVPQAEQAGGHVEALRATELWGREVNCIRAAVPPVQNRSMAENPFDACWDRLERLNEHRVELARIWNEYIDRHPFDFTLDHEGDGVHLLKVWQTEPMPRAFSVEMGEWLYNARTCLDYIIWATCAYTTGHLPPPDEETLQYPIYESLKAWKNNEARLKHLLPHHREMLWTMQPFNSDLDANYLGVINRLARIDRHRRLTISTGYLAEAEPVFEVPAGCSTELQWGQRVLVNGTATVARVTVTPWRESATVRMNPRIGIDPEIGEWADSTFWRPIRFSKRLAVIQSFLQAEVACYEYDCTGFTRQLRALTDSYRAECDARGPLGSPSPTPSPDIEWGPPQPGHLSTVERFEGGSFPSGPASVDVDRDGE